MSEVFQQSATKDFNEITKFSCDFWRKLKDTAIRIELKFTEEKEPIEFVGN